MAPGARTWSGILAGHSRDGCKRNGHHRSVGAPSGADPEPGASRASRRGDEDPDRRHDRGSEVCVPGGLVGFRRIRMWRDLMTFRTSRGSGNGAGPTSGPMRWMPTTPVHLSMSCACTRIRAAPPIRAM